MDKPKSSEYAFREIDERLCYYVRAKEWESVLVVLEYSKDSKLFEPASRASGQSFLVGVRQLLSGSDRTALIDIGVLSEGTVVFLVHAGHGPLRDDEVIWLPGLGRKFWQEVIADWVKSSPLDRFDSAVVNGTLDSLSQALWAQIRPLLSSRVKHLVFIPHLALRALPLHAMYLPDRSLPRYVIDDYEVSYAASVSALAQAIERSQHSRISNLFAVADTSDPDMSLAEAEVKDIARYFPGNRNLVLAENDLDKTRILAELKDYSVVHFACHGRFVAENPSESYLRLGDEYLDIRDVKALSQSPAQLVQTALLTLSACDTGVQVFDTISDLHFGLTDAFLEAGVATVVATLWRSTHGPTLILMREFYRVLLQERKRPPAAMQQAIKKLRAAKSYEVSGVQYQRPEGFQQPLDWANFVVVGAW
jgi:CHAT domain-containing protein